MLIVNKFSLALLSLALLAASTCPADNTPATQPASPTTQPAHAPCTQPGCETCENVEEELRTDLDLTSQREPAVTLDDWLRFGGDLRYRMYNESNIKLDNENPKTRRRFWHRPRARLWGELSPLNNISFFARITYEPRYFCEPDLPRQYLFNEAIFDQLYVKAKKIADLPLTITVGRQDIQLGESWLIREGTPLDGGRSFYFDAIRATWKQASAETTIDLVYIQQYADSAKYIRPFNDQHIDLVEQNEKGAILYVSNESLKDTTLQGYFIYKHADKILPNGYDGDLYTVGGLAKGKLTENWRYKAELAYQFGHKNGESVDAMGSDNRIVYCLADPWDTRLLFEYEYRSGSHDANSNFDILWGRYTQFSNLYNYYISTLEGQMAMSSNLHRFGPGVSIKPMKNLFIGVNYNLLFRDRKSSNYDSSGQFRGQLLTAKVQVDFNKHFAIRVLYDLFLPDSFYGSLDSTANFVQTQLSLRW